MDSRVDINMQQDGARRRAPHIVGLIAALSAACVLAVGLGACGSGSGSGNGGSGTPGTLIVAIPATPPSIDLDQAVGLATWAVGQQITARGMKWGRVSYPYDAPPIGDPTKVPGFTYPDFDVTKEQPGLLTSCEIASDAKSATFHLRHGVKSAYGNEFTAADVLWKVERAKALKGTGSFFLDITNAAAAQWKADGKYTVKVTNTAPMPSLCQYQAHFYAGLYLDSTEAKKHATASDKWATKWMATHGASFGPYYVTSWQPGKAVILDANPNYYEGAPKIKRVLFRVVPDSSARITLLSSGKVDIADQLSPDELSSLDGKSGTLPVAWRSPLMEFITMNNAKKPFDKVAVRQAINMTIPRSDIAAKIYGGLMNPSQGPTPSIFQQTGYKNRTAYTFDPAKAKALLAQAGYPNGFTVGLSFNADDPTQEPLAISLQSALAKIGVKVNLQKLPSATLQNLVLSNKAEFALYGDAAFMPDPQFVTQNFYYKKIGNYENYTNPAVVAAVDKGRRVIDPAKRAAYFGKIQDQIYEDAPLGWVGEPYQMMGVGSRVKGLAPDLFPVFNAYQMSLR